MTKNKDNKVIRGKFRLGENAFPSSQEKAESIMKKVDAINHKWSEEKKKVKDLVPI